MQTITSQSETVHSVGVGVPNRISGRTPTTCGMNFNLTFPINDGGTQPTCRYCVASNAYSDGIKTLVGKNIRLAVDIASELDASRTQIADAVAGTWDLHWQDQIERTRIFVMQTKAAGVAAR